MAWLSLYQKEQEEEGMGRAIKERKKKGKTAAAGVMEGVPDNIGEIILSKMRGGGGEKQGGGASRRWKAEGRKA